MNTKSTQSLSLLLFTLTLITVILTSIIVSLGLFTRSRILTLENQILREENAKLHARISSAENPWIPDTLHFAGQRIPLENWLVRKRVKESLSALLAPGMNAEITKAFHKCRRWLPFIDEEVAKQNLPYDFRWLYIQESKCDHTAVSRSNAMGTPQFMARTASDYGLRIEYRHIDERLLPEKAIPASTQYLRDLLDAFPHDACLALAAYNDGESDLRIELEENGDTATTYWNIDFQHDPRNETENFCPAIIRWKLIYENPEKYRLEIPEEDFNEYPDVELADTVLTEYTKVGDIARSYGLSHIEFSTLNPHILSNDLRSGSYTFRIPKRPTAKTQTPQS